MAKQRRDRINSSELTRQINTNERETDDAQADFQKTGNRTKHNQQMKTQRTAAKRQLELAGTDLKTGRVRQVHSMYADIDSEGRTLLGVTRKTLMKTTGGGAITGDIVRFSEVEAAEPGAPQAMIESIQPRATILTRSDSFKALTGHPIVANAQQMLIVVSLLMPRVKWGLVDRMLIAAQSGGLVPMVCLNKVDLAEDDETNVLDHAREHLAHYATMRIASIETSVSSNIGLEALRSWLQGKSTVLAGHSGVGKSSLVAAVCPGLDIRVGEVSEITSKGKHTTTSARVYPLAEGEVIDTPGVKLFGLWKIDEARLASFFPDVHDETAPPWREQSYELIRASLPKRY